MRKDGDAKRHRTIPSAFERHVQLIYDRTRYFSRINADGGALLYFIMPVDLIPDYIFPIGYIDDLCGCENRHRPADK
ncbi:YkvA family protein [Bacillus sp. SL00103]